MWDERYSSPGYLYGKEPNDFLVEFSHYIPKGRVLCLGEGEGRNAVYLARKGYAVTAVDSSAVGLEKARALAAEQGVEITTVHQDLADFDIGPGAWSGIVSIFCHLSSDTLKTELRGLRFIHAREVDREVREGRLHSGRAAVVQVVGVQDG